MWARPIFRPIWCLRAVCRMTASLTGNTVPARSRAILYFGHSIMVTNFVASLDVATLRHSAGAFLVCHDVVSESGAKRDRCGLTAIGLQGMP